MSDSTNDDLLSLRWHIPPRNVLIVRKSESPKITDAVVDFCKHVQSTFSDVNFIADQSMIADIGPRLSKSLYAYDQTSKSQLHDKVDLITTFGGDGTILHATSLFSRSTRVPPVLSFSMGTLGFLGEWKIQEYKEAFRQTYESGMNDTKDKSKAQRTSRVLLRNRLRLGIYLSNGDRISSNEHDEHPDNDQDIYAMNEVLLHRGQAPHLSHIQISVGGRVLTEAVADGMLVSSPTGSTAYSLSSGGSIVHPLVSSLLLTPICPRSLSFRPLVLPADTPIVLKLSEKNRSDQVDISIDGVRMKKGLSRGMEIRVVGEEIRSADKQHWKGGIPTIVRPRRSDVSDMDDNWIGGLNSLLKFNHPFGEGG